MRLRRAVTDRHAGFTLMEIMLAAMLAVMVMLLAVPSTVGIFASRRLESHFQQFDTFVNQARELAIQERQTYIIAITKEGLILEAADVTLAQTPPAFGAEGADAAPAATPPLSTSYSPGGELAIERQVGLEKEAAPDWHFWRSGICEPMRVTYSGPEGKWIADYKPMERRGRLIARETP